MNTETQTIRKGSVVESRKNGRQGIVTHVKPDLWTSPLGDPDPEPEIVRGWMSVQTPPISNEESFNQKWYHISDFEFMDMTASESELFVIPIEKVRFDEYPCAFSGTIANVENENGSIILTVRTNRSYATNCQGYSDRLVIEKPTVVPVIGDHIYGTQDVAIITADGLDYPYKLWNNVVTQDW